MGTRERRQREFAEREQRFLCAARELIRDEGFLNLAMARIAERCDYAVGTLYQHFTSKEDLLMALSAANEAYRVEFFQRVDQWSASTRDRMMALPIADMVFVEHYPEHFRLAQFVTTEVIWGAASEPRREEALAARLPLGQIASGIVSQAIEEGSLDAAGMAPNELMLGIWSLTLGTHTLVHAEGVLQQYGMREPYRLMLRHLQSMLNGMGWQPVTDKSDDEELSRFIDRVCSEVFGDLKDD